jgi:Flp pilus assembly protein TadB
MRDDQVAAEQLEREERDRLSRRAMRLLSAGLTDEGDALLLGFLAVLLMAGLYPLAGGWALLAFPFVFVVALVTRRVLRRRRERTLGDG